MKCLIILPLFFLSGVSYSQPDCETLKSNLDKAVAGLDKAREDWRKARADLDKAVADYDKADAAYHKKCE